MKKPIIFACSGCSDTGELADRIARRLHQTGEAEMSCLAGVSGRVKDVLRKAQHAERILAIDGCPLNCVQRTLEHAGFKEFCHLNLQQLGFRKGCSPVSENLVAIGADAARIKLA